MMSCSTLIPNEHIKSLVSPSSLSDLAVRRVEAVCLFLTVDGVLSVELSAASRWSKAIGDVGA
jgi:hypothetical protein